MSSELTDVSFSDVVEVTDYVANGSFASLKENVTYLDQDGYAVLVRLVDHNAGWKGQHVYVDKAAYQFLSKSSLVEGDVVIANVGANAGSVFRVPKLSKPATLGPNAVRVRPKHEASLTKDFLYYYLASPAGQDQLQSIITGSAQPKFNKTALRGLKVNIPNIEVQKLVASFMMSIDDRITLLRETNTTLESIAQALFKSWFVDFDPVHAKMQGRAPEGMDEATAALFPDSFEDSELGPVPKGWGVGTLADLATFQNGYAFKSKDWTEAGHPVIKIGNVKPGLISFDGCSYVGSESVVGLERFRLERGDLLVGMTGYVGETGLVTEVSPAAYLNQRVGRIATTASIKDLGFVFCLTRHENFKAFAEGQSHGSAQANVSGSDLLKFKSVIPSDKVVRAFNEVMETLIESIMSNHEQAQLLAMLRDSLLPRLISGQLRIEELLQ